MTYFAFLVYFVFAPILALLIYHFLDRKRSPIAGRFDLALVGAGILVHVLLALVYTTPWDNYLVATGVWSYNPALVSGVVFGWVPLEEYTFFVAETLLSGMWWLMLVRRFSFESGPAGNEDKKLRLWAAAVAFAAWLVFTALFFGGSKPWTYLSITLFWALPPIALQLLFGADILWRYRRLLFWGIVPLGLYLSLTDALALQASTWSISPAQTTGVLFGGLVPLEEVVFFFITNVLIVFGLTLMTSIASRERFAALRRMLGKRSPGTFLGSIGKS
jgi:lycopene cyclase domain-containing protein